MFVDRYIYIYIYIYIEDLIGSNKCYRGLDETATGQVPPDDAQGKRARSKRALTIDQIAADDLRQGLKRKCDDGTGADTVINLGNAVYHTVQPHLLGPSLKRRFVDPPPSLPLSEA